MHGNPGADLANTCLWIRSALMFGRGPGGWLARQLGRQFERAYLDEYQRTAAGERVSLEAWLAIQAACRMSPYSLREFAFLKEIITAGIGLP